MATSTRLGTSMAFLLARAHLLFNLRMRSRSDMRRLNDTELFALMTLAMSDGQGIKEFNAAFALAGSSNTRGVLDDLCARDLVRVEEPSDTAGEPDSAALFLTAEGRASIRDLIATSDVTENEAMQRFDKKEATVLRQLLQKLAQPDSAHQSRPRFRHSRLATSLHR